MLRVSLQGYTRPKEGFESYPIVTIRSNRELCFGGGFVGDITGEVIAAGVAVGDVLIFERQALGVDAIPGHGHETWIVSIKGKTSSTIGGKMNGKLYEGAVVVTKTVPAGEGVSTGVQVSDVVHIKGTFSAPSDDVAKAIVLAEAIEKGVKVDDQLQPVEVKLRSWA